MTWSTRGVCQCDGFVLARGVRGVKLESLLVGGQRMTSHEALLRFFAKTTAASEGENRVLETAYLNDQAASQAAAILESDGI